MATVTAITTGLATIAALLAVLAGLAAITTLLAITATTASLSNIATSWSVHDFYIPLLDFFTQAKGVRVVSLPLPMLPTRRDLVHENGERLWHDRHAPRASRR